MSEHTSATWLMPPSSNSELRLCGLIIAGLPSFGMALCWFRGGDPNLNLTSDSGLFQRSAVPGIEGIPVTTKEAVGGYRVRLVHQSCAATDQPRSSNAGRHRHRGPDRHPPKGHRGRPVDGVVL